MGYAPISALAIVFLTLAFEGLVFGTDLAEQSFPEFQPVEYDDCVFEPGGGIPILSDVGEATGYIGCILANTFTVLVNVVLAVFGTIAFLFNLLTFNVPGAPDYIRFPVGGIIVATILISSVMIFRGN